MCGSTLVFVLVCIIVCPFWFFNNLEEEERAGCFALIALIALIVFLMSCDC